MGIQLDPKKLEQLIEKADDLWHSDHGGQYRYQEHVEFTAVYISSHYKVQKQERREHAVTNSSNRGDKKVPLLRV